MQYIDAVYVYESVVRELDVACAVKCIAQQHHGMRIELVHRFTGISDAVRRYRPRIVILPHCYKSTFFPQAVFLNWRKAVYVSLNWEQILYEGNRKVKTPQDDFGKDFVIHQAWGETFAQYLQDNQIPRTRIFINGNPVYKLFDEPYSHFFKSRRELASEYGLDPKKRWVFFPENYAWAFYPDGYLKSMIDLGATREQVQEMVGFCRRSLREVVKWCTSAVREADVELILRPRPATRLDSFKAAVQEIVDPIPDRFHVTKSESTREWIMASDTIFSSYSTSLIEAAIARKGAYIVEPYPIPPSLRIDWHDHITHIRTKQAFTEACRSDPVVSPSEELSEWARGNLLSRGDAIWNLASFLSKVASGEVARPPFPTRKSVTRKGKLPVPSCLYWLLSEYRRMRLEQNPPKPSPLLEDRDWDSNIELIDEKEVEQRIDKWKQVLEDYVPDRTFRDLTITEKPTMVTRPVQIKITKL